MSNYESKKNYSINHSLIKAKWFADILPHLEACDMNPQAQQKLQFLCVLPVNHST
ncbi:MAG: hypothetical protein HUU50_22215 [Candidatus Brocadiae bacterium]|nr:hypothetical protein [Candidatus Brocadiia bacterium]